MGSSRTGREIDTALRKKGFRREIDGKHIRYFFNARIFTHISHGAMGTAISSLLIALMSRQLCLTKTQFLELIDCTLDESAYRELVNA